jgi:hypothetical protein
MSRNLIGFPTVNFDGTPYSQPIQIGNRPPNPTGPKTVRLDIDWTNYGASGSAQQLGVFCNLTAQGQVTGTVLDAIRAVYIDNTYVSVPVYIKFPDTLFTVVCPAYSVVMAPVFTNVQQFTIYGDGFISGETPITSVFLTNVDRQGFYIPAAITGAPVTPVVLLYSGADLRTTSGNFTVTGINFGAEDTDRIMVVACQYLCVAGLTDPITALTIGGAGATRIIRNSGTVNPGVTNMFTEFWSAPVPTGVSGNATFTVNAGSKTINTAYYSIRNLSQLTALASVGSDGSAMSSKVFNLQAENNGVVIAQGITSSLTPFSGVQQDQTAVLSGASYRGASGSVITNQNQIYSVTANCYTGNAVSFK